MRSRCARSDSGVRVVVWMAVVEGHVRALVVGVEVLLELEGGSGGVVDRRGRSNVGVVKMRVGVMGMVGEGEGGLGVDGDLRG